ncbi:NAD-dependent epimerase/dehydratase family protein [Vibrio splendidus]|uniref:NAD-dependent epimerase/dehydratase family protein n=1 Tax=Vibrio splendidus TaxID=29497 RepID=UPI00352F7502
MYSDILLTGSSGFVGSNFLSKFPSARCVVRANADIIAPNFFITELSSKTDWNGAFNNINSIVHLASVIHLNNGKEQEYYSVNVEGTLHLAREAAKSGVKRFVFVSSIGVNGFKTNESPFAVTSVVNPHNAYSQSKYDAEIGLEKIGRETGLEIVIIRPTLVYGNGAPGKFGLLTKLIKKLPLVPFGLSNNKRDFISVLNLVDLIMICAKDPRAIGHTFLASDGETVSIKEFTNAIARGLGKNLIQVPVPVWFMTLAARLTGKSTMAEQLLGNLQVDSSNARKILGWIPPYTMEQAMASLSENKK